MLGGSNNNLTRALAYSIAAISALKSSCTVSSFLIENVAYRALGGVKMVACSHSVHVSLMTLLAPMMSGRGYFVSICCTVQGRVLVDTVGRPG